MFNRVALCACVDRARREHELAQHRIVDGPRSRRRCRPIEHVSAGQVLVEPRYDQRCLTLRVVAAGAHYEGCDRLITCVECGTTRPPLSPDAEKPTCGPCLDALMTRARRTANRGANGAATTLEPFLTGTWSPPGASVGAERDGCPAGAP